MNRGVAAGLGAIPVNEVSAVLTVASRDVSKLLHDRTRLLFTIGSSFVLIGLIGSTLQGNLGRAVGFDFVGYVFTGVLGMALFQSGSSGLVSLVEDRESDFSQEMFVAPISRYSILLGKVLGETFGAFLQALPIIVLGLVLGVHLTVAGLLLLLPASLFAGVVGGAFGVAAMSVFNTQRKAQQVFPFLTLPQFFLAGVFTPIKVLPWYLSVLSLASPMRYVVDLLRDMAYAGRPAYSQATLFGPLVNLAVMTAMIVVFLTFGTWMFVRQETHR